MKFARLFRNWQKEAEFEAGAVIFSEGEPAKTMYVVLEGEVELTLRGSSLGIEGESGIIGEEAVIDAGARGVTATARSRVRLAGVGRKDFRRLVSDNPQFSLHVMSVFANRLRSVDRFISARIDA